MLNKLKIEDFDKVYELLKETFPSEERGTYEKQKRQLTNGIYNIYVWFDEKERVKAFIALNELEELIFIEHFVVRTEYRNHGIGTEIIKELVDSTSKNICLEVELPNTELDKRRIEFYKRNSFYLNEYPYFQPSLGKGKRPINFKIMSSQKIKDEDEFEKIKNIIYKKVYNQ